jgi:ubiquinone/menaquinone biosynthesis C-methylase UbiE
MGRDERQMIRDEFSRTAEAFVKRTSGRYDALRAPEFARVRPGDAVLEVAAGGASFLSLFEPASAVAVALDLTPAMLAVARRDHPAVRCVVGDGARLPFPDGAFDLTTSAMAFHHMTDPAAVTREMARASRDRVLLVDQVSAEEPTSAAALTELERLRDPSHATSRPASAYRAMAADAGLEIVDQRIVRTTDRLSTWMWPGEFPPERIEVVRTFFHDRGDDLAMDVTADGDDWSFTRLRLMLLARARAPR